MTPSNAETLGTQIDDKQKQVEAIVVYEKGLPDSDPQNQSAAEQEYQGYQDVLIDEVNQFQTDLGNSELRDDAKMQMLQQILDILSADGQLERDSAQLSSSDAMTGVDVANLNSITVRMNVALDRLRVELAKPAAGPAEDQVSGTLSSIVQDKFGIAYDAGRDDTKKHFAYVMALNDVLGEPNRDPNTEIPADKARNVNMGKISSKVQAMDVATINQKFEDYLAFDSSKSYQGALRALVEGRRVGGGGGGGSGGGEGRGDGEPTGEGEGGGEAPVEAYDYGTGMLAPGWGMIQSDNPSKGFFKVEINDLTVAGLKVGNEISVRDAKLLGVLDDAGQLYAYYEDTFALVPDLETPSKVIGVKKVKAERTTTTAAVMDLETAKSEKIVLDKYSSDAPMSSGNRDDYTVIDGYKWVSDNPNDQEYWQVQKVPSSASSGGVVNRPAVAPAVPATPAVGREVASAPSSLNIGEFPAEISQILSKTPTKLPERKLEG